MVDAMTEGRVALVDALRHGVPADGREAAILALALLPVTTELHKRLMDAKAPSPDLGLVATLRDGLERVALRIAPTDPDERKIFDTLHAACGGEQEGPTVLRFDYATGEAVIGGHRAPAGGRYDRPVRLYQSVATRRAPVSIGALQCIKGNITARAACNDGGNEMTDEQKAQWIALHARLEALGWAMKEHDGPGDFELLSAEVERVQGQLDALLKTMIGEDAYEQHSRELADEISAARQEAEAELAKLLADTAPRTH